MTDAPDDATRIHRIGWHYWELHVPTAWNPVQLDGDFATGSVVLGDLAGPRLGIRWATCRPANAQVAAERALRAEVGTANARDAIDLPLLQSTPWTASRLCVASDRRVWVGYSPQTQRLFQVVYHATDEADVFVDRILPTVGDCTTDRPFRWSVFDLTFTTPAGWQVRSSRFLAGDLAVSLIGPSKKSLGLYVLRQVGPASLALARQPLQKWLTAQPFSTPKLYRSIADTKTETLRVNGRTLDGLRGTLRRKRRLWWAWFVPSTQTVLGCRDAERDRLVFAQGPDAAVLQTLLESVGATSDSQLR